MAYYNEYGGQDSNYGEYGNYDQQQQPGGIKPPYVQGARPMVDPEAGGEVDPTLYPEPKEATHKIRGKSDFIELLCGSVDQELLTVKTFYFFFYSAFGSLFPLMGVYFKQMGMNPGQCGLLVGSRPFVEFLSAPFWGSLADRWQKGKVLLLASLSAWIIFTLPLGFIQPPAASCLEKKNNSYLLRTPEVTRMLKRAATVDESDLEMPGILKQHMHKRSVVFVDGDSNEESQLPDFLKEETDGIRHEKTDKLDVKKRSSGMLQDDTNLINGNLFLLDNGEIKSMRRSIRSLRPILSAGQSPINVNYAENYNTQMHKSWVRPIWSSIVYRTEDIEKAFFLLLLLVIIGEFFSAPAITLADSAVITLLGEDADRYGHQRMFGSLGWGLAMFFVGIALDHSTAFPDHPCGPEKGEKNYTICFATFSVLMGAALITATQINFKYEYPPDETQQEKVVPPPTHEDQLQAQLATQLNLPSLADTTASINTQTAPPPEGKTKMFAQTTREIPEWVTVMKQFKDLKCASFLFVAWFMGFGIGLIFTFLFWHLQDYGGSPTLFGVASVINHISEIFAYFFSFRLIKQIGHVKVLCLGLAGNVIRFLYISWLHNPWWVLPFEFMQGITHAAVWAACCSYIAHNTPQQLRSSAQGVLQGIHHGLGRGCGAVIGGIFVNYFGSTATFRGYGFICLLVLAAFIFINFYRKDEGFISDIPTTEDPHQVAEETAHLAPHGVPSNPIPRALSSTRLHDLANQDGYGATYQTSAGGNLDIPGAGGAPVNPFLQNGNQGGSYRPSEPSYRTGNIGDSNVQQASSSNTALSDQCGMAAFSASTRLETLQPLTTAGGTHASYDW